MPVSAKPLFFLCAFILSQLTAMQKTIAVFLQNFLERTPDQQLFRFVSGPAGTGKTILLHYLRDVIVRHFDTNAACRLAASTGTAAWNIHGDTLHSLIKLSIENEDAFQVLDGPTLNTLRKELTGMKYLFIDEVSMMSAKALSETSSILQRVFLSHLPFGGVSVFLFGDLLQLEPVNGEGIFEDLPMCYLPERNARSTNPNNNPLHENLFQLFKTFHLTKCVRAEKEEDVELLMKIRRGDTSKAMFRQLELKCGMSGKFPSEMFAELETLESANREKSFIILTAGNNDAKQLNDYKIGKIGEITSLKRVRATPSPSMPETSFRKVTGFVPFVKNVAIGCRIMLTYNKCSRRGLVNGAIGKLKEIHRDFLIIDFPLAKNERIERVGYRKGANYWQDFPIVAAEAITIHKAQGLTFDGVIIVPSKDNIQNGMMYTALSRARSLDLCRIVKYNPLYFKTSEKGREFYSKRGRL